MRSFFAFSLLELLIALGIFAILALLSLPLLNERFSNLEDETVAASVMQLLQFTGREAIALHEPLSVSLVNNELLVSTERGELLTKRHLTINRGRIFVRSYPRYRTSIQLTADTDELSDNATIWYCRDKDKLPRWAVVLDGMSRVRKMLPDRHGVIKIGQAASLSCAT